MHMKKLCIILNEDDMKWAKNLIEKNINNKNFLVITPTFNGAVAIKKFNYTHYRCEDIAWKINKLKLHKKSNNIILKLFKFYQNNIHSFLKKDSLFKRYPVFKMHYLSYAYYLFEVLTSWTYANNILKSFNPSEIFIGVNKKIYSEEHRYLSHIWNHDNSLSLSFETLALQKKIKINKYFYNIQNSSYEKIRNLLKLIYYFYKIIVNNFIYFFFNIVNLPNHYFYNLRNTNRKKILINSQSGYYFDMIKSDILRLSKNDCLIFINFIDHSIAIKDLYKILKPNIKILYNFMPISLFQNLNFNKIFLGRKNLNKILIKITNYLNTLGSFNKIFLKAIQNEILFFMPGTMSLLKNYEKKYSKLKLDIAFSHFDLHAFETALIFPLKKKKIPTISSSHGMPGFLFFREVYSSDFFLTSSNIYQKFLQNTLKTKKILLSNNNFYDSINCKYNKKSAKLLFNLNPQKPVCIFCDDSSFLIQDQFINSEFSNINKIIELKNKMPDIQLILRYHGGFDISNLRKYIDSFGYKDIFVQQHPNPLFREIVKAADIVITHRSSAMLESLASGVPVIYMTSESYIDPFFKGYKEIKIINNFNVLHDHINKFFKNKNYKEKKIQKNKSRFLNNFQSSRKKRYLSDFIINSLNKNKKLENVDFLDWQQRLYNTIKYKNNIR